MPASKRPRRQCAAVTEENIRRVAEWETCTEQSPLFRMIETDINQEFQEERLEEPLLEDAEDLSSDYTDTSSEDSEWDGSDRGRGFFKHDEMLSDLSTDSDSGAPSPLSSETSNVSETLEDTLEVPETFEVSACESASTASSKDRESEYGDDAKVI